MARGETPDSSWRTFMRYGTYTLLLLIGCGIGYHLDSVNDEWQASASVQVREYGKYKFINPLLDCDVAEGTIDARKQNFKSELADYIDDELKKGKITDASVYFRDLNNGPTFGVNADAKYIPASLLKVPVMMAFYHLADDNPSVLEKKVRYDKEIDLGISGTQLIPPQKPLQVGKEYTIDELIHSAIVYSDNQAVVLLINELPAQELIELYKLLGVDQGVLEGPGGTLTVKNYAAFFRILFNSSYLSQERSEKALGLLAQTDFTEGIVAGVPKNITVAHKFGESGTYDMHQIHDCGVVYYPNHPYLLCIMTKGKSTNDIEKAISQISSFVYNKIANQY
jgi:beta-lactamase class A